jgi:hypothetical protein
VEGVAALNLLVSPSSATEEREFAAAHFGGAGNCLTDRYDTYGLRMCRMLHPRENECYVRRRVSVGLCVGCGMRSRGDWWGDACAKPHGLPVETMRDHVRRTMSAQRDNTCNSLLRVRTPQCHTKYQ